MDIHLYFNDSISDAYKKKLQTLMEIVIAQGLTANRPPLLRFPGMNTKTFYKLYRLCGDFDARLTSELRSI